jgi:uncharacterized caspase-like protein
MSKQWAIVVGINEYDNLPALKYSQRDAELIANLLHDDLNFEQVFLFTNNSRPLSTTPPIPTQPTFGGFRRFLRAQFENPCLTTGDNLWFFFSGHGLRCKDKDYLMCSDSDPGDIEHTAIPVSYVAERLRRAGASNVVLLMDACRDEGTRNALGIGYELHQGVVSFYSCEANQRAYEIDELGHGTFTAALIEGLRLRDNENCATVERLDRYLKYRVPEMNQTFLRPQQNPHVTIDPADKLHLVLVPQNSTLQDIATLKLDAFQAELQGKFELAKQLWIQINIAAKGSDMDVIEAFYRIFTNYSYRKNVDKDKNLDCNISHKTSPAYLSACGNQLQDKIPPENEEELLIRYKNEILIKNKLAKIQEEQIKFYREILEAKKQENEKLIQMINSLNDRLANTSQNIVISGNVHNFNYASSCSQINTKADEMNSSFREHPNF